MNVFLYSPPLQGHLNVFLSSPTRGDSSFFPSPTRDEKSLPPPCWAGD